MLRAAGEREPAAVLAGQALDGMTTAVGPGHPWTVGCALNAAVTRHLTGDHSGAAALAADAGRRAASALGSQHPLTLACAAAAAVEPRADHHHYYWDFEPFTT